MKVKVYTKDPCPFCNMAKTLLKSKNIDYSEIDVSAKDFDFDGLKEKTKHKTVPQIFINDKFIGGFDELKKHLKNVKF